MTEHTAATAHPTATPAPKPAEEKKPPTAQELLDKDKKSLDDVKAQLQTARDSMVDILRTHGNQESNIPLSSGYWSLRNAALQLEETKSLLMQAVDADQKAVDAAKPPATPTPKHDTKPVQEPAKHPEPEPKK